jgi:hypothetical protein
MYVIFLYFQGGNIVLVLKYISYNDFSPGYTKVFLDNEYLCQLEAEEIKEFPAIKGEHFISTHIIKKTNIFGYKFRVHIKDEEDTITVEIRYIGTLLNMLIVISFLLFSLLFPEIKLWIRCLFLIVFSYSLHWMCQPLSFKKLK